MDQPETIAVVYPNKARSDSIEERQVPINPHLRHATDATVRSANAVTNTHTSARDAPDQQKTADASSVMSSQLNNLIDVHFATRL